MTDLTPRQIVTELDRFIIGQADAKRAVAVAMRNRWRRQQLDPALRDEVFPKNILMIGPTGVGKTEISRRLARLAGAPFVKVEATKFTEVGYVGRDVEQIIRDLTDAAMAETRDRMRDQVKARAHAAAEDRVIAALAGDQARDQTREMFRRKLKSGELDDTVIELDLTDNSNPLGMEIPGQPGMGQMMDLSGLMKAFGGRRVRRKVTVAQSYDLLLAEEADKLIDDEAIKTAALDAVQQSGIVFIDEIDKVAVRNDVSGGPSREGVQRDLLPLVEGTTVSTKYGMVRTDHILFIASGAFHLSKPSDLIPELQGRLPIRVELASLSVQDFEAILTQTDANLVRQYQALLATEGVTLTFTPEGISRLAEIACAVNESTENIGARRLSTVMERLLDEVSFDATKLEGQTVTIDATYVDARLAALSRDEDLSRYIL